jgi:hypothetical protein
MTAIEPTAAHETQSAPRRSSTDIDDALNRVRQALRGLEYGEISIVVQDGVVVQIERTERTRLRRSKNKPN